MIAIIGNSITAYTIAATLEYIGVNDINILPIGKANIPPILYLKYKNKKQLTLYKKIYGNETLNYIKNIKVGYINQLGELVCKISKKDKYEYLNKQQRKITKSMMSNNISNFKAIDLSKIFSKLKEKYSKNIVNTTELLKYDLIFDTIDIFDNVKSNNCKKEYIVVKKNITYDFDYIYDCRKNSNIKRFTKNTIEYFTKPKEDYIEINNYYTPFKVYTYNNIITIGRTATKTQTKQEDVIRYILENKNEIRVKK